jgi:uncharacterized protein (DUF2062 family)
MHATLSSVPADLGSRQSLFTIVPERPYGQFSLQVSNPLAILSIIHNTPSETALSTTVAFYVFAAFIPVIIQIIMSAKHRGQA